MVNRFIKRIKKPVLSAAIREQIREINRRRQAQERARVVFTNETFRDRHDYNYVYTRIAERIDNPWERQALRIASQEKGLDGYQFFNYYKRILRRIIYDEGARMPIRDPEQIFSHIVVERDATVYTLDFGDAKYNYRINLFLDALIHLRAQGPISYVYVKGMNAQMCRNYEELEAVIIGDDYDIYEGDGTVLMNSSEVQIVVVPPHAVADDDDGLCVPRAICRGILHGVVPISEWDTKRYFSTKAMFEVRDGGPLRYEVIVKDGAWKKINLCDPCNAGGTSGDTRSPVANKRKMKGVPTSADIVKYFLFKELKVKDYKPEDYMRVVLLAEKRFDTDIVTYTDEAELKDHVFTHEKAIFIRIQDHHATLASAAVPMVYCYDCKNKHYDGVTYKQYQACSSVCDKCGCKKACRLHNCANVWCETCQDYVAKDHDCGRRWCEYCQAKKKVGHTCYMKTETKKIGDVDAVIVDRVPERPEAKVYYSKDFKRDVLRFLADPDVQVLRKNNEFYQLELHGMTLRDYHKILGDVDASQVGKEQLSALFNYTTLGSYCYDQLLKSLEEKIEGYTGTDKMMKGGRIEVFKKAADGRIEVWDYSSMYPAIMYHYPMFTAGYRRGVDLGVIGAGCPYLLYCTVLPPKDLLHPVLPTTIHHKQMYTLCRKCAEDGCDTCNHTDEERQFTDWFSSLEFELALQKGYTYSNVTDMIICTKPSRNIFKKYIGEVYRAKENSTGELRKFNKMRLNMCFGKFAQVNSRTETAIVRDRFEGARYLDKKPRITELRGSTTPSYLVSYAGDELVNNRSNVLVAAWITAIGRYKLYNLIEQAIQQGCTPLYCNTDSLFVEGRFQPRDELSFGIKCEGVYSRYRCLAPNYYSLDDEVSPKNLRELAEIYDTVVTRVDYNRMELERVRVWRRLAQRHPKRLESTPYGFARESPATQEEPQE